MNLQIKQQEQENKFIQAFKHLLGGALSGAISRTAVAPVERTIILRQIKSAKYLNLSMIKIFLKMIKTEGISSLFKGNMTNCLRIAPFQAIEFFMFDIYKNMISNIPINQTSQYLISGALAGITASASVYPLDLTKTLLAVNYEKKNPLGIFGTMKEVYKNKGLFALYKGLCPSLFGIAPYASLKLTFFQLLKNTYYGQYYDKKQLNSTVNLIFGGLSGCMAVTVTYPTDLIRRRYQVMLLNENQVQQKIGVLKMIGNIVNKEGFLSLYAGLWATYVKILPSSALAFALIEKFKMILNVKY